MGYDGRLRLANESSRDPALASPSSSPVFGARPWALVAGLHVALTAWLFGGALLRGELVYFRDLSSYYAPLYAFASRALSAGLWPLWNPTANAGEPFLLAYPLDLLLILTGGWRAALGVGQALHLLLALFGMTALARSLGLRPAGAALAGAVYGLGGPFLSLLDLGYLYQAAAWSPWVVAATLWAARRPTPRSIGLLALLLALQVSTLGAEVIVQTVLVSAVLACERPLRQAAPRLLRLGVGSGLLAVLLAAPVLLGARALLAGTSRGRGFMADQALAFSLHPALLLDALLPAWLGKVHGFDDADLWSRAYFPTGFPYFVTLYLGLPVLLIAAQARRPRRLWALAAAGVLIGLGEFGPLGLLGRGLSLPLRGPQKYIFLTHLALALLAGFGLERGARERPGPARVAWLLIPGLALCLLALGLRASPETVRSLGASVIAGLADPRAALAARATWPAAWLPAGALALVAGVALALGGRFARLAAAAAVIDLAAVNLAVSPLAPASFYELRQDVAGLLETARQPGHGRLYSYGVAQTPDLRFEPFMAGARSDVWLYYLDRQTLLPLTPSLDGFDGAFDLDRTGWAPPGATLSPDEAVPARFRECYRRLRGAGVRWVLSFAELAPELVTPRGEVKLPEISQPLRLFELRAPLPRAYYAERFEVEPDPARRSLRLEDPGFDEGRVVLLEAAPPASDVLVARSGGAPRVDYLPLNAHALRIKARTPPGFIVVLDGYDAGWEVEEARLGRVPLLRANSRYRVIQTPGGEREWVMRFRPRWRAPALLLFLAGLCVAGVLMGWREGKPNRGASRSAC